MAFGHGTEIRQAQGGRPITKLMTIRKEVRK